MPDPIPTILVVDDQPLLRVHAHLALEDAGFAVIEAQDSADALAMLDRHPGITALFTDIAMPGSVDGLALAAAVHARRPDIAIVVTSGVCVPVPTALPHAAIFLPKPFTLTQLRGVLGLDLPRGERSRPAPLNRTAHSR